jgi:hypothetical protein
LLKRFGGEHFWDFLETMTAEQFASCTLDEQKYINDQILARKQTPAL